MIASHHQPQILPPCFFAECLSLSVCQVASSALTRSDFPRWGDFSERHQEVRHVDMAGRIQGDTHGRNKSRCTAGAVVCVRLVEKDTWDSCRPGECGPNPGRSYFSDHAVSPV